MGTFSFWWKDVLCGSDCVCQCGHTCMSLGCLASYHDISRKETKNHIVFGGSQSSSKDTRDRTLKI